MTDLEIKQFMKKLNTFMTVSFVIWILIIVYQAILGLLTFIVGYGITTWCCMVWNIIGCVKYYKTMNVFKNVSTKEEAAYVIQYFESSITSCWIFMFVNLIFGGFLGFIGNLYDLILSYYVKGKKGEILMPVENRPVVDADWNEI